MPLLALPTLFTRSVEITGTRTTFHSNHQVLFLGLAIPCILVFVLLIVYSTHRFIKRIRNRDYSYNSTPLPSHLSLFGDGSLRHPEYDLEDGIKARRITVDDISQPKLLYGTGPFAWDFCNSDNRKQIDEDDNTLIQLEDSRNPFITNSDDEDTGQLSTLDGAEGVVNRDGVDFAQTRVVSRSTPKPEYILRSPTEYAVEYHFNSSASAKDHDNDVLNDTSLRDNTINDLDKTLRNNRLSALVSEIEKLGNTLKEAPFTREDDSVSDLKPNQYSDPRSEASSFRLTVESQDESSMVPEMVNLPICTRRGVLLASRRFVTKEHAQRILLERRIEMQRSPELRSVIPIPFARDPCMFGRASTPAYPCYFSPRPESIKKLRKCLMKQFNTEALYLPAIPSLLVPGSEFFRPRSGNRLTGNAVPPYPRSSNTADDRHEILVLSSAPLRRRLADRLLVKVLKRAHYDALTANAPLAPMTSDGSDPFSDSCVAQSPFDDPRASSCPCQTENLCVDHAGTPATVKRKPSISAQLSIIRSSLKKRSSFGTISGPRIPKGEIKEDGALLESSSVRKTTKNGVLVNQVVDALAKATRVKKGDSMSGKDFEKSTRRTSSLARQACSKPRGLSDISNRAPTSSLSPGQLPSYPASVKQGHSQHHRKPIVSLVLSENLFRHKRTLSIHSVQHPYTLLSTSESPASRNLWTPFSLKRASSRV